MRKFKLSPKALNTIVDECIIRDGENDLKFAMPRRDPKHPLDVLSLSVSQSKIEKHKDEIAYMLGQLHVFHTNNRSVQYQQLTMLYKDGKKVTNWTGNDPVALNQLARLGFLTGFIYDFKKVPIPMKDGSTKYIEAAKLPPVGSENRVKPVFHREGPSLDD